MVLQIVIKLYGSLDKNTSQLFNYFLYLSEICKLEIEGTKHEIESSKQHNQRKINEAEDVGNATAYWNFPKVTREYLLKLRYISQWGSWL